MDQQFQIDHYIILQFLGKGAFGDVYEAMDQDRDLEHVAIKYIDKQKLKDDDGLSAELLESEISVLQMCNSDNVVRLLEVMVNDDAYYLVFEFCNGGDLWGLWEKNNYRFSEIEAVSHMKQILNGLKDLHALNVIHRDLKLPNILINDAVLKIGDLGFAKRLNDKSELCHEAMGSLGNMAPEVIEFKPYGLAADMFSLGSMFYQLLFGNYPFPADSYTSFLNQAKTGVIDFESSGIKVTKQCQELIVKMLKYQPEERITWEELYDDPVFKVQDGKIALTMNQLVSDRVDMVQNKQMYKDNKQHLNKLNNVTMPALLKQLTAKVKACRPTKMASKATLMNIQAQQKKVSLLFQQAEYAKSLHKNPEGIRKLIFEAIERNLRIFNHLIQVEQTLKLLSKIQTKIHAFHGSITRHLVSQIRMSITLFENVQQKFPYLEFLLANKDYQALQARFLALRPRLHELTKNFTEHQPSQSGGLKQQSLFQNSIVPLIGQLCQLFSGSNHQTEITQLVKHLESVAKDEQFLNDCVQHTQPLGNQSNNPK